MSNVPRRLSTEPKTPAIYSTKKWQLVCTQQIRNNTQWQSQMPPPQKRVWTKPHHTGRPCVTLTASKFPQPLKFGIACIAPGLGSETKLTPWSRGLLGKLTVSQLVKKFPAFYGTRRFITAFTRARHLSLLSQLNPVHALPPSHFLKVLISESLVF
jgi:hypothetical protein